MFHPVVHFIPTTDLLSKKFSWSASICEMFEIQYVAQSTASLFYPMIL